MLLPLRSTMLWISSFPNNSKQPTCTPARVISGSPESTAIDVRPSVVQAEVHSPAGDRSRHRRARRRIDVLHIREAFGSKQLVGDVLRANADAGRQLREPDDGRFGRLLCG